MSSTINYKLNHRVTNISCNGLFNVDGYISKRIIFAIPANNLKQISFLKPIYYLINSVKSNSLFRAYAVYPTNWFEGLPVMTTNSFIRHIIPIDSKRGLIMISYVEGNDVNVFLNKNELRKDIKQMIQKEIKVLFPNKIISEPTYFKTHYWKIGDHAWKPGYDSVKIAKKIINPMPNIYICGETFSHTQSWVEGALETAKEVLDILEQDHM